MQAWVLAAGFLVLWAAAFRFLAPLHPLALWALPWAAATTLYACRLLPYKPLSATSLAIIAGCTAAFATMTLLAGGRRRPVGRDALEAGWLARAIPRAARVVLALTLIWLLAFIVHAAARFGLRPALVSTPEVRDAIIAGEFALTIKYVYGALAAALLCGMAAALERGRRPVALWLGLAVAASMSCYFTTGRSTAVVALLTAAIGFAMLRPEIATHRRLLMGSATAVVLAVVALFAGGAIIGKTYASSELPTIDSTFTDHDPIAPLALPYEYATAPIASLNELVAVTGTWGNADLCATLSVVCAAASAVGAPLEPDPVIRPFTKPPLPWNTYTALDAPLIDGGLALAVPITGLLGLMVGLAWRYATICTAAGLVGYPILAVAVLFSIVQNNFFASHFIGALLIALGALLTIRWSGGRVRS